MKDIRLNAIRHRSRCRNGRRCRRNAKTSSRHQSGYCHPGNQFCTNKIDEKITESLERRGMRGDGGFCTDSLKMRKNGDFVFNFAQK
jgi:hypothetical protein